MNSPDESPGVPTDPTVPTDSSVPSVPTVPAALPADSVHQASTVPPEALVEAIPMSEEKLELGTIAIASQSLAYHVDLRHSHPAELQLAMEGVEDLRKTHSEENKLNLGAVYMSPWDSTKFTLKFYPLLRVILRCIYQACRQQFNSDLLALNFKLRAFQCWSAIYEQGNQTLFHNHFPADFSAICYLQMAGNAAPIILERTIECKIASGGLLFFQGHMNHHVPKTEGLRCVLVANFYKLPSTVPTYQDPYLEGL